MVTTLVLRVHMPPGRKGEALRDDSSVPEGLPQSKATYDSSITGEPGAFVRTDSMPFNAPGFDAYA